MAFAQVSFIKLPDPPNTEHMGLYTYLMQLNQIVKGMSGRGVAANRVIVYGDLVTYAAQILGLLTPVPAWEDLRFPVSQLKAGLTNPPDWVELSGLGSVFALAFNKSTSEDVYFTVQLPHSWKEGSELRPHIHWTSDTGNAGDVVWKLEQTLASVNTVFPSTTTTEVTAANPAQFEHKVATFDPILMRGETVSNVLMCRLYRDGGNSDDTLDEDAFLLEIDFHYQVDSFGSYQEFYKT